MSTTTDFTKMPNDLSSPATSAPDNGAIPTGAHSPTHAATAAGMDAATQRRFERMVSGAHQAVDSAAESMAQAAEALRVKANRLGELEAEYADAARGQVREHPLSYLAGALLLGVLLGRLTSR